MLVNAMEMDAIIEPAKYVRKLPFLLRSVRAKETKARY